MNELTKYLSDSDPSAMALMSVEEASKRIRRPRDTKEIVAFWWDIYRALVKDGRLVGRFLPTANDPDSKTPKTIDPTTKGPYLNEVLEIKRKTFYEPWGDVTNTTFEAWWKTHRDMFIEEGAIQEVPNEKITRSPTRLYVSINLKKSHWKLTSKLKEWILERQTKQGLLQNGKLRSKREVQFRYNERTQIHLPTFRELHRFFKYVYLPEIHSTGEQGGGQEMKGINLWNKALRYYRGKPKPKFLRLGSNLTPVQKASVLKTLSRYVERLDDMCRHVANGMFP